MKKSAALLSLLFAVTLVALAQSKSLGLGADFTSAALAAVRVIDSSEGVVSGSGTEAGDALNSTAAVAHSQGEHEAMKSLQTFFDDKLDNNLLRAQVMDKALNKWKSSHADAPESELQEVREQALDHPGVREMTLREDDCAASMSRMLRGGTFRQPERCDNVRLSRDEHAMQQFFN